MFAESETPQSTFASEALCAGRSFVEQFAVRFCSGFHKSEGRVRLWQYAESRGAWHGEASRYDNAEIKINQKRRRIFVLFVAGDCISETMKQQHKKRTEVHYWTPTFLTWNGKHVTATPGFWPSDPLVLQLHGWSWSELSELTTKQKSQEKHTRWKEFM